MTQLVRERIYEALRDEITYGELLPGERLTEQALSETFHASRSTIRECLRQLESEGLLAFEKHKGYRVSKHSTRQVAEIYNLRWLLESYAARLTAEHVTASQMAYLEKAQQGCIRAAAKPDLRAWISYNSAFHNFFYEHCGNDNLKILLDTLKRRIYRYQYIIMAVPGHFEEYIQSHEKILAACRDNAGQVTESHMKKHLSEIKKVLLRHLQRFPAVHPG